MSAPYEREKVSDECAAWQIEYTAEPVDWQNFKPLLKKFSNRDEMLKFKSQLDPKCYQQESRQDGRWGFYLDRFPAARQFRDSVAGRCPSYDDLIDAIEANRDRETQKMIVSICAYAWNGDEGYGGVPSDTDNY